MEFNNSYLNRTPNKTPRNTNSFVPEFVVLHETAGYGSLDWNLRPEVRSSYNYLISRNGTIYHYVDEQSYVAWHAGVNSSARGYTGGQLNTYAIGVEVEGPNDGTPITTAQTKSLVALLKYFNEQYGIPLTRDYFFGHSDVAPGYKSDPRGYSVEYTLKILSDSSDATNVRPDTLYAALRNEVYKHAGGEYRPDWAFHQYAEQNDLGSPIKVGMDFSTNGVRYTGEVYGRDVIISPYGQWNVVLRANELTDNAIYADLMKFTFSVLGLTYRPEQAFAAFIRRSPIGVPLTDSQRMTLPTGRSFAVQLYTLDTLFTPIAASGTTDWSVVRLLSTAMALANIDAAEAALRDVIYSAMYERIKDRYDANAPFIKYAFTHKLGAPLSGPQSFTYKDTEYVYVIYAGDTLFAPKSDLNAVKRLSEIKDQ